MKKFQHKGTKSTKVFREFRIAVQDLGAATYEILRSRKIRAKEYRKINNIYETLQGFVEKIEAS